MRTRLAALPLVLVAALGVGGCSDTPETAVTDEGVIETPTGEPDSGEGLDAPSGEPLVPDSSTEPGVGVTTVPSPG